MKRCQIGMQALFTTGHHPRLDNGSLSASGERLDIVAGDDCWIGARAVLLPGVKIAANVTIGAGAVVTMDLAQSGT
jgi:maltose O-acetyltransferase